MTFISKTCIFIIYSYYHLQPPPFNNLCLRDPVLNFPMIFPMISPTAQLRSVVVTFGTALIALSCMMLLQSDDTLSRYEYADKIINGTKIGFLDFKTTEIGQSEIQPGGGLSIHYLTQRTWRQEGRNTSAVARLPDLNVTCRRFDSDTCWQRCQVKQSPGHPRSMSLVGLWMPSFQNSVNECFTSYIMTSWRNGNVIYTTPSTMVEQARGARQEIRDSWRYQQWKIFCIGGALVVQAFLHALIWSDQNKTGKAAMVTLNLLILMLLAITYNIYSRMGFTGIQAF